MTRQALGRFGETAAAQYLAGAGLTVTQRNYRCPFGEIDLVARDGQEVVFVEVRTRGSDAFGPPEESVGAAKAARMGRCALHYVAQHRVGGAWRVDLVAVHVRRGRVVRLEHFKHVLEE